MDCCRSRWVQIQVPASTGTLSLGCCNATHEEVKKSLSVISQPVTEQTTPIKTEDLVIHPEEIFNLWRVALLMHYVCVCVCIYRFSSYEPVEIFTITHRSQTQGPQAESSPPPCFIWPCTLFLPGGSAQLSLNC